MIVTKILLARQRDTVPVSAVVVVKDRIYFSKDFVEK